MMLIAAQVSTQPARPHQAVQCVADCGIVTPLTLEAYVSIILLGLIIAAGWLLLRRWRGRRR